MEKLKEIKTLVFNELATDPATRNSDRLLIRNIYRNYFGINGDSFEDVILNAELPSFETIRRTRQKLQRENPKLRADKDVQSVRDDLEETFREYFGRA